MLTVAFDKEGILETYAARNPKVQKRPNEDPTTQSHPATPPSGGISGFSDSTGATEWLSGPLWSSDIFSSRLAEEDILLRD